MTRGPGVESSTPHERCCERFRASSRTCSGFCSGVRRARWNCAMNAATSSPAPARRCSSGCWPAPSSFAFETAGTSHAVRLTSPIARARAAVNRLRHRIRPAGLLCLLGRPRRRRRAAALRRCDCRGRSPQPGGPRAGHVGRVRPPPSDLAPQSGVLLRDIQLCELANPAKWDNEEWLGILRSLGLSDDKLSMHRKPYEFTQLLFGCRRLARCAKTPVSSASAPDTSSCSTGLPITSAA